jgi:Cu/Ag efflux pump CusA
MLDLRTIAEWDIKPVLMATPGVAQVTIIGGDYKQYQVLADPNADEALRCQPQRACRDHQGNASENTQGGVMRQYGNEYVVRGMARTNSTGELGASLDQTCKRQSGQG